MWTPNWGFTLSIPPQLGRCKNSQNSIKRRYCSLGKMRDVSFLPNVNEDWVPG